jgi:hypothetical protein
MGSDIYTESAVAIRFDDFLDRKELDKKSTINAIVDDLIKNNIVVEGLVEKLPLRKDKYHLAAGLVDLISMSDEGYEDDRERNTKILTIFCENVGIDLDNLPECNFRSFESSRESGWDVETDVLYLMFEPSGLFETKMTKEGKKFAKFLGKESIEETTWTVHSY